MIRRCGRKPIEAYGITSGNGLAPVSTCFAPVLTIDEAKDHPHLKARRTYVEMHGVNQPAPNPRFSATAPEPLVPPAALGQHSQAILADWGISADEIDALCRSGTVFQSA